MYGSDESGCVLKPIGGGATNPLYNVFVGLVEFRFDDGYDELLEYWLLIG